MPIIIYKPTTAARRNMSVIDYTKLSKVDPEKSLLAPLNNKSGRNSYGRITVLHHGGGCLVARAFKRQNSHGNIIPLFVQIKTAFPAGRGARLLFIIR